MVLFICEDKVIGHLDVWCINDYPRMCAYGREYGVVVGVPK